jgi:hypothetical protein
MSIALISFFTRLKLHSVTIAGLWPDKTGTRLPAYCQIRLPGRTMAVLDCRPRPVIAYQCDATQIDANIDGTQIDANFNLTRIDATQFDVTHNYPTCNHDEIGNKRLQLQP